MKITKIILQLFFIALLVGVLGFTNTRYKNNTCKDFKITFTNSSASFVSFGDILHLLESEVDSVIGYPIADMPLNTIENKIENKSNIDNAEVYFSLNNCLHIDVQQKTPIARIKLKNQDEFYMDDQGAMFDLSYNYTERVLVANGDINDSTDIHKVYLLSKFIKSNTFWKSQIVQIYFNERKEIELIPRVGNHTILLGNIVSYKEKLNKLRLFYEQGVQQTGWNKYKEINLKYKDQIVCVKK